MISDVQVIRGSEMEAFDFLSQTHLLIVHCENATPEQTFLQLGILVVGIAYIPSTKEHDWKDLKGPVLLLPPLTAEVNLEGVEILNDPLTSVSAQTPFFQTQNTPESSVLQIQIQSSDQCVLLIRLSAIQPFLEVSGDGAGDILRIDWSLWGTSNAQLFLSQSYATIGTQDCHLHGSRVIDLVSFDSETDSQSLFIYDFNAIRDALPPGHWSDKLLHDWDWDHPSEDDEGVFFAQYTYEALPCTRRTLSLAQMESDIGECPLAFLGDDYVAFVSRTTF
jgi:hypothetical protein